MWLPRLTWQRAAESGRTKVSEYNRMCKDKHVFKWSARLSSICTLQFILYIDKHLAKIPQVGAYLVALGKIVSKGTSASARIWNHPYHFLCLMKKVSCSCLYLTWGARAKRSVLVCASCHRHTQQCSRPVWSCPHPRPPIYSGSQLSLLDLTLPSTAV